MNKELSVGSIFTKAWETLKASQKSLGVVWLIIIAINLVLGFLDTRGTTARGIEGLILFVFNILSMYVLTRLSIMAVRGQSFVAKEEILKFDWMKVLMLVVLSVIFGIAVGIGMVLLVVPGIIIAVRFMLSSYVFLDENLNIVDSAKRSLELTRGHGWDLFLLGLVLLIAVILISVVTLGLAAFVATPIQILIGAVVYDRLRNDSIPETEDTANASKIA